MVLIERHHNYGRPLAISVLKLVTSCRLRRQRLRIEN